MLCPFCRAENAAAALRCAKCGADFSLPDAKTLDGGSSAASAKAETPRPATSAGVLSPTPVTPATSQATGLVGAGILAGMGVPQALEPGSDFGPRYRIEALLGEGGMGTVYKAYDKELDRVVALKMLRPELMLNPELAQRFKQELLLASRISHKNILRIHDLGDVGGVKFFTMAYVAGEDLHEILKREGRMKPDRIAKIARQLCGALEAAHAEGVLHRDLKPHNVLIDAKNHIFITDFGLAKSLATGDDVAMTRTGQFLGTPKYMSPEQVEGKELDNRSDLYSLGLIFYEMATGDVPFKGTSTLQVMYQRVKEPPKSPRTLVPDLPEYLEKIILRCLERDPAVRYQSAAEILADFEAQRATSSSASSSHSRTMQISLPLPQTRKGWWLGGAGVMVLLLLLSLAIPPVRHLFFGGGEGPAATNVPQKAVTLLITDFQNTSGEPVFDSTLEPVLNTALEGASFINTFSRAEARRIGAELQPDAKELDESLARLVAVREGISVVVSGSIAKAADGYTLKVRAVDAATGNELVNFETGADNREAVLKAVGRLAARVRKTLGDVTPESLQLAAAETFTSSSIEAAQAYARGQELQFAGKYNDAVQQYLKAAEIDPDLGRAYTSIATIYANQGRMNDADTYFKLAFSKIDRMSDREKYRTRSAYYLVFRNPEKAIEELAELVRRYPADTAGLGNLALAYFYQRQMTKAVDLQRRALDANPKDVVNRVNAGLYAMYAGDFDSAIRDERAVLEVNPSLGTTYVGLALSQLALRRVAEATGTYQKLAGLDPLSASVAAVGLADLALSEGRGADAITILEKGIQDDSKNKADPASRAIKLDMLAESQLLAGHSAQALAAADKALAASKQNSVLFWAARIYLATGHEAKALAIAQDLGKELETDPQAYAKVIEGEVELKRGKAREAIKLFEEARKLADTWMGRFDAGRAYLELGSFAEAYDEFETCLKRQGEATAAFLDETPTYRLVPPVYYYLGRAQEGLNSPAAADSFKTFLSIREKGTEDQMMADARRRLAGR